MPRSMTTWIFNVLRQLISNEKIESIWIDSADAISESRFEISNNAVLAKCHHFSERLANSADLIIYSYRDIRTAAVSARRKFGSPCNKFELDGWISAGEEWLKVADAVLKYENVLPQPVIAIAELRGLLTNRFGAAALANLSDATVLSRVDAAFENGSNEENHEYDKSTLIIPGHRTFQPMPDDLTHEERSLYEWVQKEYSAWLLKYGYLSANDLGQEIEYQISAKLIQTIDAQLVVDVGVERGSFIELARAAGAKRIIGFEPLPRHQEFLRQQYSKIGDVVEILPYAISDSSGFASLHVATDAFGNELDYHHTLSDLGDSNAVKRSQKEIPVQTFSLKELCLRGVLPFEIDLLKIDTDGHDLNVLNGLVDLRPKIVMAEYWDDLPESSGRNSYFLSDLVDWAKSKGYERHYVIRRNSNFQSLELNSAWSVPGDWGNVIFLRNDVLLNGNQIFFDSIAKKCHLDNLALHRNIVEDAEKKELVIRGLDDALKIYMNSDSTIGELRQQLVEKEKVIQELNLAYQSAINRVVS